MGVFFSSFILNSQEEDEDEDYVQSSKAQQKQKTPPTSSTSTSQANSNARLGLTGVVSLMTRSGRLSSTEATLLMEMVRSDNDYVLAAYELYESDQNIEELQDTLLRCAKLEVRKRVLDVQEEELGRLYKRSMQGKYDEEEEVEEEEDDGEEDDEDEDKVY